MRVLLTTAAWPSHYLFMVPLAWAFRAAGHEVRIAAQPHVVDTVLKSGLTVVPVGPDLDFARLHRKFVADTDPAQYRTRDAIITIFHRVAEMMTPDLVRFAETWRPHLVVRDPVAFAGSVAAEVVGAPLVRHAWGPDLYGTAPGAWLAHHILERLGPTYELYGATPPTVLDHLAVDPTPPSLHIDAPGVSVPMAYVPYNGPGVVPSWAVQPPTRPRVCVTWGTFTSTATDEPEMFLVPRILDALDALDVEPVLAVTAAERDLLGDVGDRATVVQDLPIHTILSGCAAVIHHGGATTVLSAARFGVPQLTIPHLFEQRLNSDLLETAGASIQLKGDDRRDPVAIRAAVTDLIRDGSPYAAASRRLREEILAMPPLHEVVGRLEQAARADAPTAPAA
ncbi:nucleotide disphospho-sugar-binding domain-containing protein [Streptomyces minutiscleroticus]|uniref:Glycosyl transferase n=3 Tax=Streptomyces TaxID=1883 RepID=A0A918NM29_9ACTN|nr:nucleotide disphospho-sugar-binding domain-containing protein [Streptomyces minutiscleroticus]AGG12555.1 glycosyltransferase [Streptomyces sp. 275]AXB74575.1 glycosyltransferase [Streptomyces roseiscleroticus]GGX79900.1 glycosyl transferase [Streptomyces minutiscleroticus]